MDAVRLPAARLLGSEKQFNQHWRHPIERGSDHRRATLLAQRLRPFILRRRKDQVASELPPKTVITRAVEMESGQRDLYETVRAAMEKQVREAISGSGWRSHIVVLDALLKLRQVCCDPRLLPGDAPARNAGSAKLDLLREMLPSMVEEGRRILLFSQFTGMLSLIAQALDQLGLAYVTLTGDTQDRATPVQRFMQGEVPVFLISLKAGGVGLNLTAADTVIHFDPWWNPAENQASDRAHRIGQQQPVFVYRLIAAGSIEERIAELQERKATLATPFSKAAALRGHASAKKTCRRCWRRCRACRPDAPAGRAGRPPPAEERRIRPVRLEQESRSLNGSSCFCWLGERPIAKDSGPDLSGQARLLPSNIAESACTALAQPLAGINSHITLFNLSCQDGSTRPKSAATDGCPAPTGPGAWPASDIGAGNRLDGGHLRQYRQRLGKIASAKPCQLVWPHLVRCQVPDNCPGCCSACAVTSAISAAGVGVPTWSATTRSCSLGADAQHGAQEICTV